MDKELGDALTVTWQSIFFCGSSCEDERVTLMTVVLLAFFFVSVDLIFLEGGCPLIFDLMSFCLTFG